MADSAAAGSSPGARPERVCVSFDLDGTLWPPAGPVLAAAGAKLREWLESNHEAVAAAFAGDPDLGQLVMTVAKERPDLCHCFTALRREALRRAAATGGADPDVVAEGGMAVFRAARDAVTPYAGVAAVMRGLAASGVAVVTLTNGNAQLEATPLAGLAVAALSATSAGAAKPCRAMFDAVVGATGVPAEATVHVGDDSEADVSGRRRLAARDCGRGMRACFGHAPAASFACEPRGACERPYARDWRSSQRSRDRRSAAPSVQACAPSSSCRRPRTARTTPPRWRGQGLPSWPSPRRSGRCAGNRRGLGAA